MSILSMRAMRGGAVFIEKMPPYLHTEAFYVTYIS